MTMKLGYSSMTAGFYDLDEAFRLATDLELDFVELTYDVGSFLPASQKVARVNELSRATGVTTTLHLPFIDLNIASLVKTARCAAVDQTLRALEYAEAINAQCGVLHTGTYFIYQPVPKDAAYEALLMSLSRLKESPVKIALENLGLYIDSLVRDPDGLKTITNAAGFYNCLDFGHAFIEQTRPWHNPSLTRRDLIQDYIDTLGNRIIHLHLCNNDGQSDMHTATPDGNIAYGRYADFFTNFKGTICLEVAGGKDSVTRSAQHLRSLIKVPVHGV